jgi:uncharacterized protein YjbI with pentapeptide repeats
VTAAWQEGSWTSKLCEFGEAGGELRKEESGEPPRRLATALLASIAGLALIAVVIMVPTFIYPPLSERDLSTVDAAKRIELQTNRLKLQNDLRTTLLQGLGGMAVLIGALFTWWQLQINRRQFEHGTELAINQMDLARQGQITERFTRAVDQLGHVQTDVRLGGIYALARIARDSGPDQDYIARLLAAYIREHASWGDVTYEERMTDRAELDDVDYLEQRAADVQAAVKLLGSSYFYPGTINRLWLGKVNLRKSDLDGAQLQGINLNGARLELGLLSGARLDNANLYHAHLEGAILIGASLHGAHLEEAHLEWALLYDADLTDVQGLDRAHLTSARVNSATVWPKNYDRNAAEASGVLFED